MHALALLSLAANGLLLPPTVTFKGEALVADNAQEAVFALQKNLPARRYDKFQGYKPWSDGNIFKSPLPESLIASSREFKISPSGEVIRVVFIACAHEEQAKEVFLQLHLRRVPDYARSGKFLIKADKQSMRWFLSIYGGEVYFAPQVRSHFTFW